MPKSMKSKVITAAVMPATAALALTGCAAATTTCVVRHGYAIVIFQNAIGNNGRRFVTRFRLNVKYGPHNISQRLISSRIMLRAAKGGNPPVIVRTYRVGGALGCRVDKVSAHR
jgi:hypothetical protein